MKRVVTNDRYSLKPDIIKANLYLMSRESDAYAEARRGIQQVRYGKEGKLSREPGRNTRLPSLVARSTGLTRVASKRGSPFTP